MSEEPPSSHSVPLEFRREKASAAAEMAARSTPKPPSDEILAALANEQHLKFAALAPRSFLVKLVVDTMGHIPGLTAKSMLPSLVTAADPAGKVPGAGVDALWFAPLLYPCVRTRELREEPRVRLVPSLHRGRRHEVRTGPQMQNHNTSSKGF